MQLGKVFGAVLEALGARRVFGEPVEQGGTTVIPAATVIGAGGAGGGEGMPPGGEGEPGTGAGMGYALLAWPSGAYEVRDGGARWVPALDVNRLAALALVLLALLLRSRRP